MFQYNIRIGNATSLDKKLTAKEYDLAMALGKNPIFLVRVSIIVHRTAYDYYKV